MIEQSPLGQKTVYTETYAPELLFPVPRSLGRDKIGFKEVLPFDGEDIWTGYELSWLNPKGKPVIAMAEFRFPALSLFIVESKSFKLYLNSLTQSSFESVEEVRALIEKDLQAVTQADVKAELFLPGEYRQKDLHSFSGVCLDKQDISASVYQVDRSLLFTHPEKVDETVYSDLLKSNCLATGQADWGSVFVHYCGDLIDHEGLLQYIISYRRHSGFAEHCVESFYKDIWDMCRPEKLTVYVRYTRRGGLDINCFRSNFEQAPANLRHYRQ